MRRDRRDHVTIVLDFDGIFQLFVQVVIPKVVDNAEMINVFAALADKLVPGCKTVFLESFLQLHGNSLLISTLVLRHNLAIAGVFLDTK